MEDTRINFETAKLAKEKGFPQSRKAKGKFRDDGSIESLGIGGAMIDTCKEWYERPTQSLLAKWLREKYNLYTESQMYIEEGLYKFKYDIKSDFEYDLIVLKEKYNFSTYEEALEIGLQEALKLI